MKNGSKYIIDECLGRNACPEINKAFALKIIHTAMIVWNEGILDVLGISVRCVSRWAIDYCIDTAPDDMDDESVQTILLNDSGKLNKNDDFCANARKYIRQWIQEGKRIEL